MAARTLFVRVPMSVLSMSCDGRATWQVSMVLIALWLPVCAAAARAAPNPTLVAIPANTALDLGRLVLETPAGSAYNAIGVTDYSGFVYEPLTHQMLMFGGGHATTHTDAVYSFNFSSLSWVSAYHPVPASFYDVANYNATYVAWQNRTNPPMTPLARHTYDTLVVPGQRGTMLMFTRNTTTSADVSGADMGGNDWPSTPYLAQYDTATTTWRWINAGANTPPSAFGNIACEYDPVSDMVVIVSQDGLWTYDPKTETAARPLTFYITNFGYANDLVYFPPNQKMYYMARGSPGRVFEVTLNRANWAGSTFVEVTGMTNTPSWGEAGWACDTANQVIGGGVQAGQFRAYNPLTKVWTVRTMNVSSSGGYAVGDETFHCLAYDPVDGVFLFIADGSGGRRTWAYRYAVYNDPTPPTAPQNVQATPVSQTEIDLSWNASTDPESGVVYYQVYRDGAVVAPNVTQTSYADTGLTEATAYTYEVVAVNGALLESARSTPATATTLADTTPPTITAVSASGPATQVNVVFSEPLEQTSAQNAGNYSIGGPAPINVIVASLSGDGRTVTLTTDRMTNGATYTLAVSNVTDRARTPNAIAPGTQVQFTYIASVLLVDFGPSAGTDTYGLAGWTTTIKDVYTENYAAGPGGMAVKIGGSSGEYNYQGVTSATPRMFAQGEKVVVTWYNNHATATFTFTPRISFDDPNRPPSQYPPVGTWYSMTPLTLGPKQTGTTEFVVDAASAGNYSLVNVNANYTFASAYTMVCDKIELIGAAGRPGDVNGDGHVDVGDLLILVHSWATSTGQSGFDPRCDFNTDGRITILDLLVLVNHWGT